MSERKTKRAKRGKLIVFEGLDASGKKTQATLFAQRLRASGARVKLMHFPAYDTRFGKIIARYLRGDFGAKEKIPPESIAFLYALDRAQFKNEIEEALARGICVVCDRFTPSNLYQAARVPARKRAAFIKWLDALEESLPRPDAIAFLDVDPSVAARKFGSREQKNPLLRLRGRDVHESDTAFQREVRKVYLSQAREKENKKTWLVVDCVRGGEFKPVREISELVWVGLAKTVF